MRRFPLWALAAALAGASCAAPTPSGDPILPRMTRAADRGAAWLLERQDPGGMWMYGEHERKAPSVPYTAMAVSALASAPPSPEIRRAIAIALPELVTFQNADGSFGDGPGKRFLRVYTTAAVLLALQAAPGKYEEARRRAGDFLLSSQAKEGPDRGSLGLGDAEFLGRGPQGEERTHAFTGNLAMTGFAALALVGRPSFHAEAAAYASRCQNLKEGQDPAYLGRLRAGGIILGDDGSFFFAATPDRAPQKAGFDRGPDGETIRGYGSTTAQGLLTLLVAGVPASDPRVRAGLDWLGRNWTPVANPGFAKPGEARTRAGYFHFLFLSARLIDALWESHPPARDWAVSIGRELVSAMKEDGRWVNEDRTWAEFEPLLCTAYAVDILNILCRRLRTP